MKINKILIANRGEIALRILRTCKEMNIRSTVVYSDIDRTSLHVLYAEEAYSIGAPLSSESYLRIDKIIDVAKTAAVDAIHPGYGFLSENAEFAEAVANNNMLFIGPSPETIKTLGDKTKAKSLASSCGVNSVPGASEPIDSLQSALETAEEIGFPVLLKAASGGGGKGMRIVNDSSAMEEMLRIASSEAESSFGDSRIFIEKYISCPHHIEFQILADTHGNTVHLGDRECSVQRRYQKIMEESPSPFITDEVRSKMGAHAVEIMKAAKYTGAGTVEFLVNSDMDYYFLEVNTRL
ncbi:MAG: ATP-grasp domain-containing protein, partial [Candidatus Marinimicrobia bacterium]|nr:ATP-grasp domain-containing protein [Candidatus Neomarinimicrobiota bacterium]